MNLRSIVRDGLGSLSRRGFGSWRKDRGRSAASISSIVDLTGTSDDEPRCWAGLPPELLREVLKRLEQSESAWPGGRDVVAFASVCRSWRRVCKEMVRALETTGKLIFPVGLKQPGYRGGPVQCYIKRNKATSTYFLFLGLDPEHGKFLLAARKVRRATHAEFIISMTTKDISSSSVCFMGKLRSNFLGTKFAIFDSQPPYKGAVATTGRSSRRFYSRKVSPKVPSGSYGIAHIAYELNMLGTRGPRRMRCAMYSIPASALEPNGRVPSYEDSLLDSLDESFSSVSLSQPLDHITADSRLSESSRFASSSRFGSSSRFASSARFTELSVDVGGGDGPLILKNKPPRWHEQLQCWCLNFRGRVTIASVKNFQLIAASRESVDSTAASAGSTQPGPSDHDKIILQFGKIGKDLFTMDYRYPLSAFQAFAICLSSFDSKLACE